MGRYRKLAPGLAGACLVVLGAGCANTPNSDFYLLSPISDGAVRAQAESQAKPLSVGVGPVTIPEYLDRQNIVTRPSPNRIEIDEFHRWGGSLRGNLLSVVAQNLSLLLGSDDVVVYPWEDPVRPHFLVRLSVRRLDGSLGADVELDVRWVVVSGDGRELLAQRRSVIREPVPASDYEALVTASSRALAAMSREIAEEIASLRSAQGQ